MPFRCGPVCRVAEKNFWNSRTKASTRRSQSMERSRPTIAPSLSRQLYNCRFGSPPSPGLARGDPAEPRGCRVASHPHGQCIRLPGIPRMCR